LHELVVVGGGSAGVTAALRARELGAGVALVERGELGGTCTNDGCVPTRVLAHAARLVRDAEQLAYPTFTAVVGLAARRMIRTLGLIPLARAEGDGNEQLRAAEWELRSG
jgi:pyruvate/2-oxoglutarate dehydrogenase complex dihydrolipoamide dehydrogenase (E3) component